RVNQEHKITRCGIGARRGQPCANGYCRAMPVTTAVIMFGRMRRAMGCLQEGNMSQPAGKCQCENVTCENVAAPRKRREFVGAPQGTPACGCTAAKQRLPPATILRRRACHASG